VSREQRNADADNAFNKWLKEKNEIETTPKVWIHTMSESLDSAMFYGTYEEVELAVADMLTIEGESVTETQILIQHQRKGTTWDFHLYGVEHMLRPVANAGCDDVEEVSEGIQRLVVYLRKVS
jgi:hypothetical protein